MVLFLLLGGAAVTLALVLLSLRFTGPYSVPTYVSVYLFALIAGLGRWYDEGEDPFMFGLKLSALIVAPIGCVLWTVGLWLKGVKASDRWFYR